MKNLLKIDGRMITISVIKCGTLNRMFCNECFTGGHSRKFVQEIFEKIFAGTKGREGEKNIMT